jgi:hypothetical protein
MIRMGDHDALIISNEVVERLPNIEMLLEGVRLLLCSLTRRVESRVITRERIVYRRNSYHVAIAPKNGRIEVIERDKKLLPSSYCTKKLAWRTHSKPW